jgi:hypothetical protein
MTEQALEEMMHADLSELEVVPPGVEFEVTVPRSRPAGW